MKYLLFAFILMTSIIMVAYLNPKATNFNKAEKDQNENQINTNSTSPTSESEKQTVHKNSPTPPSNNTELEDLKQKFLKEVRSYYPPNINYNDWLTYRNSVHGYSLKYPKDWTIDYSHANNTEDYQDLECCNTSKLVIYKDFTKWELLLDVLYTGGQGWTPEDFDECYQNQSSVCVESFEGPINVSGLELYKKIISVKTTGGVLSVSLGETNNIFTDIKPVFGLSKTTETLVPKYGSINYSGKHIGEYIEILDGITLSLEGLK